MSELASERSGSSELASERSGSSELPGWLATLAGAVRSVQAGDVSRFLPPEDGSGRPSAVLIALADGAALDGNANGPAVLLIERAADMRTHAGQVAFPGGAVDPGDTDAAATALREASEEVGLDAASVQIIAELPSLFLPPSGFVVTPVVAWWARPHAVHALDPREVARVAVVPIAELADPANRFQVRHPSGFFGPGFEAGGIFIWGFTAGLLSHVLRLGGWERPWDESQLRDLPSTPPAGENSAGVGTVAP